MKELSDELKTHGIDGTYKHLDSTPPEGVAPPTHVMTQEVVVENNPQPLRAIRPYANSCLKIPATLGSEATVVLHALFECFAKAKEVREGLIGDLAWGFSQVGIAVELTLKGLLVLEREGYIKFQAPDGAYVDLMSSSAEKAFVRYQPKLLEMVYDGD